MSQVRRPPVPFRSYILVFGFIASLVILAHGPLLKVPFYWDEAGQFVPASLDLLRAGAWIPVSTVPNVHPPGVMAYLAAVWFVFGYSIAATRIAMLLVAALGLFLTLLLGIELARGSTGAPAFAAVALLCLSPLFFAQSMLVQLDLPAMCGSTLALLLFLQNRFRASAAVCSILVLLKETGVVVPALFGCWLLLERHRRPDQRQALWFLLPLPGLLIWLLALHHETGHWFGNPAFTAYNLREPLSVSRFLLAIVRRLYYLFIGSGHFIGTFALCWALRRIALFRDRPWRVAAVFAAVHIVVVSLLGGAVLERYLLPVLPVVYIAFTISLRALLPRARQMTLAALMACLIAANFINPFYPFPFENNLMFVSFVDLERRAADAVESRGEGLVATSFPMADVLRNPDLGFVRSGRTVNAMSGFSHAEIAKLKLNRPDMVVVWKRTWDPLNLLRYPSFTSFLARHYAYVPDMRAEEIARALSMRIEGRWIERGLSMELLMR